jgi:hypothetical protein
MVCSVALALGSSRATGQTTLPSIVEKAMRANEAALDPISVVWTEHWVTIAPATRPAEKAATNANRTLRRERLLAWQKGKIYSRSDSTDQGLNEVSYDGRVRYMGNSRPKSTFSELNKALNAEIVKKNKRPIGRGDTMIGDDYFTAVGLRALSTPEEMAAGKATPEAVALIEGGARVVSVEEAERLGIKVLKLHLLADNYPRAFADRRDRRALDGITAGMTVTGKQKFLALWEAEKKLPLKRDFIFYCDPAKSYAVIGREERYEERLLSETASEGFRQVAGRTVWLPGKSVTTGYTGLNDPTVMSDQPLWRHVVELKEIKLEPVADSLFVLDYRTPGTMILDQTLPGKPASYTVKTSPPGDDRKGPPPGSEPLATATPAAAPADRRAGVIAAVVVGLVVVVAGAVWLRRRNFMSRR